MAPQSVDMREEILREFHCSRFVVHPGGTKMYHDLCHQYYWSGMKKHVGEFVRRCLMCQQVKAEHQRPAGLLQPLEVAELKWENIMMDFVTHLSILSLNTCIYPLGVTLTHRSHMEPLGSF